ncbi:MAG: ChbG/HpnK family deacetylase [Methylocystaceae bacterium]|nr:ChbG/HpnK family deacetylase [Methylocystaceae bacterium]
MPKVIINADDFGLTDGICDAIYDLFEIKAITSTTLMTAAIGAVDRISKYNLSILPEQVGVHLQLTGGKPLSPLSNVPSLLDKRTGLFKDFRSTAVRPNIDEVELEWDNQIKTAIDLLGCTPSHLDSHHGMHRRPELTPIYIKLAKKYKIPVRGALGTVGHKIRECGVPCTVALVKNWTTKSLNEEALKNDIMSCIENFPMEGYIEIVTHPGFYDNELASISSVSSSREVEYLALKKLSIEQWFLKNQMVLTTYGQLI